jgi:hypothetical protein
MGKRGNVGERGRSAAPQQWDDLVLFTVLSLALWLLTALYALVSLSAVPECLPPDLTVSCPGPAMVMLLLLVLAAAGLGLITGIWALRAALQEPDWLAAAAFAVLLAAAALVAAGLILNLDPVRPLFTAVYGFPPEELSHHPVAFYGAAAPALLTPLSGLIYARTREPARPVSDGAGPLLLLVVWLAVRLAG